MLKQILAVQTLHVLVAPINWHIANLFLFFPVLDQYGQYEAKTTETISAASSFFNDLPTTTWYGPRKCHFYDWCF